VQQKLDAGKSKKRESALRLAQEEWQLVDMKFMYYRFKVNRVRHGFVPYTATLKSACENEMDVFIRRHTLVRSINIDSDMHQWIAAPVSIPIQFRRRTQPSGSRQADGIKCFSEDDNPTPGQQHKTTKPKAVLPTVDHSSDGEEDQGQRPSSPATPSTERKSDSGKSQNGAIERW
jgi:hypothetical protein